MGTAFLDQLRAGERSQFPNPTLTSAFAHYRFDYAQSNPWRDEWYGEFFSLLGPADWTLEPFNEVQWRAEFGPEGISSVVAPPSLRMHYRSKTEPLLIQAGTGFFALLAAPPYSGWERFEPKLEAIFNKWVETTSPESIPELGIKYMNHLPKSKGNLLSDWLDHSPYIPDHVLTLTSPFLLQYGYEPSPGLKIHLVVGDARDEIGTPIFSLDFQLAWQKRSTPLWSDVRLATAELRVELWKVFTSLLSENYVSYLQSEERFNE